MPGGFELLSPDVALRVVEESYGLALDGTLDSYSSYVNRVYGIREENGDRFVVKFYRPGGGRRRPSGRSTNTSSIAARRRFLSSRRCRASRRKLFTR